NGSIYSRVGASDNPGAVQFPSGGAIAHIGVWITHILGHSLLHLSIEELIKIGRKPMKKITEYIKAVGRYTHSRLHGLLPTLIVAAIVTI
ncbi:hypothetical protein, partial [Blastomonas sp.]|uniref:hypothetical protein n=1 Tax=Blastomonas sp. TaxID=1909299 RepID=UPI00262252FB